MQDTISFIGGGNMANSLIGGLIANGWSPESVCVAEPEPEKRAALQQHYGVQGTQHNDEAVGRSATVVLAVKPQVMSSVVKSLAESAKQNRPLVVSIAAGVRETDIRRWLGYEAAIVRTMPNTPALVQCGATALYANPFVSDDHRNRAESILRSVGITLWVDDEALLDAVTAVSGSGPAYFFLVMELTAAAGVKLGLSADTARTLALQTALGAAKMALESPDELGTLRARVTSPGGTTERALDILTEGGIERLFSAALEGARDRSIELGDTLGQEQ